MKCIVNILLILTLFFKGTLLFSNDATEDCFLYQFDLDRIPKIKQELLALIRDKKLPQKMVLNSQQVLFPKDLVHLNPVEIDSKGKGGQNYGVFQVDLKDAKEINKKQRVALKVSDTRGWLVPSKESDWGFHDNKDFSTYLAIHKVLGELDFSPKLHGFVIPEALKEHKAKFENATNRNMENKDLPEEERKAYAGILMDEVVGAWNFSKTDRIPFWLSHWSLEKLQDTLVRIKTMEHVLNELGIYADDKQFFLSSANEKVYLVDIDLYKYIPSKKNDFTHDMRLLVQYWEQATGLKYPEDYMAD